MAGDGGSHGVACFLQEVLGGEFVGEGRAPLRWEKAGGVGMREPTNAPAAAFEILNVDRGRRSEN